MAPMPKRTRPCEPELERAARRAPRHQRTSRTHVDARVAPDRQPAPAAEGVEPALGRRAVGVLEDPDLVEVALVGIADRVRDRPSLAAEDELVEGTPAAARTVEPVHQRVPAEPWSASTWSRREAVERERRDQSRCAAPWR